jgi:hypothetical protein
VLAIARAAVLPSGPVYPDAIQAEGPA